MSDNTPIPDFYNLEEVEDLAKAKLSKLAYDYYSGGSESCFTVRENRAAFAQYKLLPRMLVDVSKMDMSSSFLGMPLSFPVMVAPMAMHGLAHPDREVATALAAKAAGIPFVFSTVATSSLDEIAATGHPAAIFQLYVIRNRQVVKQWVQTAEALGFKALMITVDAQRLGRREADDRNRFTLPADLELKNLAALSKRDVTQARAASEGSGLMKLFACEVDDSLTWEFIPWIRSVTKLPIILKGILAPEDALLAVQHGVDAIVVSNHGGRQLDYAPSALEMLPAVVQAVDGRVPVLMDGGIRRGTDVVKALALGAKAVLLGRPVLYGLALGGQEGVEKVLGLLRAEVELAMALAGCPNVRCIGPQLLLPVGNNSSSIGLRYGLLDASSCRASNAQRCKGFSYESNIGNHTPHTNAVATQSAGQHHGCGEALHAACCSFSSASGAVSCSSKMRTSANCCGCSCSNMPSSATGCCSSKAPPPACGCCGATGRCCDKAASANCCGGQAAQSTAPCHCHSTEAALQPGCKRACCGNTRGATKCCCGGACSSQSAHCCGPACTCGCCGNGKSMVIVRAECSACSAPCSCSGGCSCGQVSDANSASAPMSKL